MEIDLNTLSLKDLRALQSKIAKAEQKDAKAA
jgi:hypothetical protein